MKTAIRWTLIVGLTTVLSLAPVGWSHFAHTHGKRFHYARASTRNKLQDAAQCGADSIDTAAPIWIPRQLKQFIRWTQEIKLQPQLLT